MILEKIAIALPQRYGTDCGKRGDRRLAADNMANTTPSEFREVVRNGLWRRPTPGVCLGYTQANLVVIPGDLAFDFLLFASRNPKPCPIIEVLDRGIAVPRYCADGADIRTDIPKYRVYRHGKLAGEADDIISMWRDDLVAFLLGCSFSFESALLASGVPVRHIECGCNAPMYITNIKCRPAGVFSGPMVVSMRPIPAGLVARAVEVTAAMHAVHGAPVHIGNPESLGIRDLAVPDFGDPAPIRDGEIPVFWACGVTPQAVALTAGPELMITHSPGFMFITDIPDSSVQGFLMGMDVGDAASRQHERREGRG